MGYYEILEYLEKQLEDIQDKQEYLKKKRERAIHSRDIAEEFNLNIRSVFQIINKMQKRNEIETIKGKISTTRRYYILSQEYLNKKRRWK